MNQSISLCCDKYKSTVCLCKIHHHVVTVLWLFCRLFQEQFYQVAVLLWCSRWFLGCCSIVDLDKTHCYDVCVYKTMLCGCQVFWMVVRVLLCACLVVARWLPRHHYGVTRCSELLLFFFNMYAFKVCWVVARTSLYGFQGGLEVAKAFLGGCQRGCQGTVAMCIELFLTCSYVVMGFWVVGRLSLCGCQVVARWLLGCCCMVSKEFWKLLGHCQLVVSGQ